MTYITYPFDSDWLLQKKRSIKKQLLSSHSSFIKKNIAILGGSTTGIIKDMLEIFLLNEGIDPSFYESEYNQYWQDAMFDPDALIAFKPDLLFIHTTSRNINRFPDMRMQPREIDTLLDVQFEHFSAMWGHLFQTYSCPIIQNNFERPLYRLMGNKDVSDNRGKSHFVYRLNGLFYDYAQKHDHFYIHDIDYLAASYGLEKWSDPFYWHMYKYALCLAAIPEFSFNAANIIKSIYGKNKKALILDLDNTLWGGVIGDDGVEHIALGPDDAMGQAYSEFQAYIHALKSLGVVLGVASKNEEANALAGLNHPNSMLPPDSFVSIKANWNPKDRNLLDMADELNLGADSFVFVDDNPAERHLVREQITGAAVPEMNSVEHDIHILDRGGFFEVTQFSDDDLKRTIMYHENAKRQKHQQQFKNYDDYLKSLTMHAAISSFDSYHLSRITQLINKSNQFNLTAKRYTENEVQAVMESDEYIALYGTLKDKFGDNGVVSIIIGHQKENELHIDLWIMSCRVLKRNMEHAMLDQLMEKAKEKNIKKIVGFYYPTAKNHMVSDFYKQMGFSFVKKDEKGNSVWNCSVNSYVQKNHVIQTE